MFGDKALQMGNVTNMKNILNKYFGLIFVQTYLHNESKGLMLYRAV